MSQFKKKHTQTVAMKVKRGDFDAQILDESHNNEDVLENEIDMELGEFMDDNEDENRQKHLFEIILVIYQDATDKLCNLFI